jgi:hypothetical protein
LELVIGFLLGFESEVEFGLKVRPVGPAAAGGGTGGNALTELTPLESSWGL